MTFELHERLREATGYDWHPTDSGRESRIIERNGEDGVGVLWRAVEGYDGRVTINYVEAFESGVFASVTVVAEPGERGDAMERLIDRVGFAPGNGEGQRLIIDDGGDSDGG